MRVSVAVSAHLALSVSCLAADDVVQRLVDQLRDDDVQGNASEAMAAVFLLQGPPTEALHRALDSTDWQQRQLACYLLWKLLYPSELALNDASEDWRDHAQGKVTRRLLEVTIEGLRDDALPLDDRGDAGSYATRCFNAQNGFVMLCKHAHEARELLEAGTKSDDYQQRYLCALVLGCAGVQASVGHAAPILIPHLRQNDIYQDASWSAHGLYGFGSAALPYLDAALPEADAQQRELINLITQSIFDPPADDAEGSSRVAALKHVTGAIADPVKGPEADSRMAWLDELPR